MAIKKLIDNAYQISLGVVNCFIIDDEGLTLIDTGFPGSKEKIFKALAAIGKKPADIKQIILTHLHPDHSGSTADIQEELQIPVYAHKLDARLMEKGICSREPMLRTPGFKSWLIDNLFMRNKASTIKMVDNIIGLEDNQVLPILSGIRVIHTPGHSAGHICLLLEKQHLLIAADICANAAGLDYSILYEDPEVSKKTLQMVGKLNFDIACFGHGNPIMDEASKKFIAKFG